ncbi:MAG: hypothetical protein FWG30_07650 [Eubacteriaceae bacterium]|nr:hypothetical protein [Eubacteriaceae bacterium]
MSANSNDNASTNPFKAADRQIAFSDYLNCLLAYKGLPTSLAAILEELLKYPVYVASEEPTQLLFLNMALKQQIAEQTGKTVKRVEQVVTKLVKAGMLIRVTPATYQINSDFFGFASVASLTGLKMEIDFKTNEFKATFEP